LSEAGKKAEKKPECEDAFIIDKNPVPLFHFEQVKLLENANMGKLFRRENE